MMYLLQEVGRVCVCLPLGGPGSLRFARSLRAPLATALGEGKPILSLPLVGGIYQTFTSHTYLIPKMTPHQGRMLLIL